MYIKSAITRLVSVSFKHPHKASKMAPVYKLTYFDIRGVAEPIRYLFKYGNIDFEDDRIKHEDWPKFKETTPFGQLPVLEHKGKRVNQSIAICRYVGNLVKLVGNDDWENLEIDAIADTINDAKQKITPLFSEQDEEKKKKLKETIVNESLPYYYSRLDAIVQKNKGYLALGRLTWADLFFAASVPFIDGVLGTDLLSKYSNLKALSDKVHALPAIKKWVEERPKSQF